MMWPFKKEIPTPYPVDGYVMNEDQIDQFEGHVKDERNEKEKYSSRIVRSLLDTIRHYQEELGIHRKDGYEDYPGEPDTVDPFEDIDAYGAPHDFNDD